MISPHARREIDLGLAAMVATMPEFFAFKDEPQKKFFIAQGALITIGSELTQYPAFQRKEGTLESGLIYAICRRTSRRQSPLPSLWKFGGLTPLKLIKLSVKKIGEDELSTRSAALSYYFLLALFPMLLFLVSLVGVVAGPGSQMRDTIISSIGRLAPGSASTLIHSVIDQTFKNSSGIKLAAGILGALWAASGGMSAVVTSLNVIYRTPETRPWWKQKATIVGLTLALAALSSLRWYRALWREDWRVRGGASGAGKRLRHRVEGVAISRIIRRDVSLFLHGLLFRA